MTTSWLHALTDELVGRLPEPSFSPRLTFGFDQVEAAIRLVENAIEANRASATRSGLAKIMQAAADPTHSFIEQPVFAPFGADLWSAEVTFPLILRRSLFISICCHVEYVLRRWCIWLHAEWALPQELGSFKRAGGSDLRHCVRYLHEVGGLALADVGSWPEWVTLDGYRLARNALAHNGGLLGAKGDRRRIEALPYVKIDDSCILMDGPVVHLLPGACETAAESAEAFFERVAKIAEADPRTRRGLPS